MERPRAASHLPFAPAFPLVIPAEREAREPGSKYPAMMAHAE
jgi:hypothetical protein